MASQDDIFSSGDNALAPTLEPLLTGAGGSPREALSKLATLRFRYVQLSATVTGMRPRDLDRSARRDVLATLRRNELIAAGLDMWIPAQHFLDPAKVDWAVTTIQQVIELAADLGRCPLSFTLPKPPSDGDDPLRFIVEAISAVAERHGVLLADHAVPVNADRSPWIGLGVDPAAWLSHNENPANIVTANGKRVVSARICDLLHTGLRGPLGIRTEGRLDVLAYKVALSVVDYRKPVIIDARQWIDPWSGIEQTRSAWQSA